eukprot:m.98502 g.98502  ORF g.98502 m.98502 type:complete len:398 (-) comp16746_c0_seq1:35-1228(-)
MLSYCQTCVLFVCITMLPATSGLHAYGHAYGPRPYDFNKTQYAAIAAKFEIFTVEKAHAAAVYGNASAKPPFSTNSIAATIGTARKIKALNTSVKVLMYWNAALHYNMYECESQVQSGWLYKNPTKPNPPFYNYSIPEFRTWWVQCAVNTIQDAAGALDGLFLDATPKVDRSNDISAWGHMVDELRAKLGGDAIIIDNGFFLAPSGAEYAGSDAWNHTGVCYVESMAQIGRALKNGNNKLTPPISSYDLDVKHLQWLAEASAANPHKVFIGHGHVDVPPAQPKSTEMVVPDTFRFGLVKYMLVTSSMEHGYFLANNGGYEIDDGLLDQPMSVYTGQGVGCGEPTEPFIVRRAVSLDSAQPSLGSYVLSRKFQHGHVELNLASQTALIDCAPPNINAL